MVDIRFFLSLLHLFPPFPPFPPFPSPLPRFYPTSLIAADCINQVKALCESVILSTIRTLCLNDGKVSERSITEHRADKLRQIGADTYNILSRSCMPSCGAPGGRYTKYPEIESQAAAYTRRRYDTTAIQIFSTA